MSKSLPKDYNGIVEQLIRPTGLLDPKVEIRPSEEDKKADLMKALKKSKFNNISKRLEKHKCINQVDDLINEIKDTTKNGLRVLVTTLTKRMSEDLSSYLEEIGVKVQYLHSEINAMERVEILRDLRLGKYDVVVGINLLREGLDLPEVSLVVILDADKEGFLRSETSLVQTIGRAARHDKGRVIMYADSVTGSMYRAVKETLRRRKVQEKYNTKHGIIPKTIEKEIKDQLQKQELEKDKNDSSDSFSKRIEKYPILTQKEKKKLLNDLEVQMLLFSDMMEFEKAAELRDTMKDLKN